MTDAVDRAQTFEEMRRAIALQPVLVSASLLTADRPGLSCVGCGDPIERERRAAVPGAKRCLICQEAQERRLRTHAR